VLLAMAAIVLGPASGCGGKAFEAAATATVAGAMTLAELAAANAASHAANDVTPVGAGCDHWGQVGCYAGPGLTLDEARARVLFIVNHVRAQDAVPPLAADFALTAFAQDGSKQLLRDHLPHGHIAADPTACIGCDEVQDDPNGYPTGPVERQIDGILDDLFREGPGGANHDVLVNPRWHRIGIGLANAGGPMFLTIDVAP
jgi:hypothetical protein